MTIVVSLGPRARRRPSPTVADADPPSPPTSRLDVAAAARRPSRPAPDAGRRIGSAGAAPVSRLDGSARGVGQVEQAVVRRRGDLVLDLHVPADRDARGRRRRSR